jgi:hypothetical protein
MKRAIILAAVAVALRPWRRRDAHRYAADRRRLTL